MKITFLNQNLQAHELSTGATAKQQNAAVHAAEENASFAVRMDLGNHTGERPVEKDGSTILQLRREAEGQLLADDTDMRIVCAHTMSEEDYRKAEEEGFAPGSLSPEERVTILDRVKAEVAKSGEVITGYNDDLRDAVLAEVFGSSAMAGALSEELGRADVPVTEDALKDVQAAWDMARELKAPGEQEFCYLLENHIPPTIEGLYLAQSSGAAAATAPVRNMAPDPEQAGNEALLAQMEKVAEIAVPDDPAAGLEQAKWLFERSLPVTAENVLEMTKMSEVDFPITEDAFAKAVSIALSEGKKAVEADLTAETTIYREAADLLQQEDSGILGRLSARRELEEVRLRMTAEVNVELLRSGISIDTAPMEELIGALKAAEEKVSARYFPASESPVEDYRLMNRTERAVADLASAPADVLGLFTAKRTAEVTLEELSAEGNVCRDTYVKASQEYEALMTAPRSDLGDSIRSAFRNVDALLESAGLEATESSRRAVRILGYNSMEISPENVAKVEAADAKVRQVITGMKPALVLNMIREGINPLEKSLEELNDYVTERGESFEGSSDSYAKFLVRLEDQRQIAPEEREAYIGIYRLIHQIEKLDGAAIGAVVNQGADLELENLLRAVRSRKAVGLDAKVDDSFGGLTELLKEGRDIVAQIETGFSGNESGQEQSARRQAYAEEMRMLSAAAEAENEARDLLTRGDTAASADNLLAARALAGGEGELKALLGESRIRDRERKLPDAEEILEHPEDADEIYTRETASLQELLTQHLYDAESRLDVRSLQLLYRQLSIARKAAENAAASGEGEYFLQTEVGGKSCTMHVRLEKGENAEAGRVSVTIRSGEGAGIRADLTLEGGTLKGAFFHESPEEGTVKDLGFLADIFCEHLKKSGIAVTDLSIETVGSDGIPTERTYQITPGMEAGAQRNEGSTRAELFEVALGFLKAAGEEPVV
ncbi:MAG: DUF6240 domain-containing protein [Lachnospiraceae bacterium]|nr:DUF6240 domain-containing protein [Lachnospiraceae bacterium]